MNSYVAIHKHQGATKGLMSLSMPNILMRDEPNEIEVKAESDGTIEVFVNKYDSFRVNDTSYPIDVKYVSFASYNFAPMEFYYNCSTFKRKKETVVVQSPTSEKPITTETPSFENVFEPIVKTVYTEEFSAIELGNLIVSIISLSMNIIQLYCMYLFFKYLDE